MYKIVKKYYDDSYNGRMSMVLMCVRMCVCVLIFSIQQHYKISERHVSYSKSNITTGLKHFVHI